MDVFSRSQFQLDSKFYRILNAGLAADPLPLLGSLWDDVVYAHRDSPGLRSLLLAELLPSVGLKCLELLLDPKHVLLGPPDVWELLVILEDRQARPQSVEVLLGRPIVWESLDFWLATQALENACLIGRADIIPPLQARLAELEVVTDDSPACHAAGTGQLGCLKLVLEGVKIDQSRPLLSSIAGLQSETLRWLLEQDHWHPQAPEWALLSEQLEIVQQVLPISSQRVGPLQLRSLLIFSLRNFLHSRWALFLLVDRAAPASRAALNEAVRRGHVDVIRILISLLPAEMLADEASNARDSGQPVIERLLRQAYLAKSGRLFR